MCLFRLVDCVDAGDAVPAAVNMQNLTAAQKEDLVVGLATLAIHDGGVELSVRAGGGAVPLFRGCRRCSV